MVHKEHKLELNYEWQTPLERVSPPNVYNVGSYIRFQIHISVIQWTVERNFKRHWQTSVLFGEIKSENLVNGLIRLTMERTMLYTISWYISCASQGFDLRVPFREERERETRKCLRKRTNLIPLLPVYFARSFSRVKDFYSIFFPRNLSEKVGIDRVCNFTLFALASLYEFTWTCTYKQLSKLLECLSLINALPTVYFLDFEIVTLSGSFR